MDAWATLSDGTPYRSATTDAIMLAVTQDMVATDARTATLVRVIARSLLGPSISCRQRTSSLLLNQIHEIRMIAVEGGRASRMGE